MRRRRTSNLVRYMHEDVDRLCVSLALAYILDNNLILGRYGKMRRKRVGGGHKQKLQSVFTVVLENGQNVEIRLDVDPSL